MSKSCYFIFKVAEKLFFYLFALKVGVIAVFTAGFFWSFLSQAISPIGGSEICPRPFSFFNMINQAFICTFVAAGTLITDSDVRHVKNVLRDTADLLDRRATISSHWQLGQPWSSHTHTVADKPD